jgi:type IV pilus assembly protein PilN
MSELVVEKRMWLTELQEKDGSVKAVGIALDNPTIAEYMTRIESSLKYIEVKLLSIKEDTSVKGLKLKNFDISFRKAPPKDQSK